MSETSTWRQVLAALSLAWEQRNPREKLLLITGSAIVGLATLWSAALSPAIQTWREAPARQAQLDAQSEKMLQLKAQVQGLKNTKTITRSDAVQWLEKSLAELGPDAKISVEGDRATLRLVAATPEALSNWIGMARELAMSLPVQAQLKQTALPPASLPGSALSSRQGLARPMIGQPQNPTGQPGAMGQPGPSGQPNQFNAPPASVQVRGNSKNDTFWSGTLVLRLP